MAVIAARHIRNEMVAATDGNWLHGVDNGLIHGRFGRVDGVPYCRVGADAEHWIEFVLQAAKVPALDAANGNECVFYLGPDSDLRLRADGNTLKEEIVIYRPILLRQAVFECMLHGVVSGAVDGRIEFYAAESVAPESAPELLFSISDLIAVDAAGRTTPVVATFNDAAGTITLELADAAWWDTAAYPVVVDPTITTSTSTAAVPHSQSKPLHYANGLWWCAFNNGTGGVITFSSDGVTFGTPENIFSASNIEVQDTILVGTTLHCSGKHLGNLTGKYRQLTLNADGSTTKGTEVSPSASAVGTTTVGVDSSGRPWFKLKPNDIYCYRNTQTDGQGTWTAYNQDSPSGWSQSNPGEFIVIPDASGDLLDISWRANSGESLSWRKWTDANTSWGGWNAITSLSSYVTGLKQVCTRKTSDNSVHTVVITNTSGAIKHFKRAGADPWGFSTITSDVTGLTSHTRVALAVDGTNLYLFYDKNDNGIYWRKFDGSSWGAETTLKAADSVTIQGAFAAADANGNGAVGIVYEEGTASPYNLVFANVSTGGGTQSVSFTASGGAVVGGTLGAVATASMAAVGGATCGGGAAMSVPVDYQASGGAVVSGQAAVGVGAFLAADGGALAGGGADVICTSDGAVAVGGALVGGYADINATVSFPPTQEGGAVIGGSASVAAHVAFETSGGYVCGGGADLQAAVAHGAAGGCICGGTADVTCMAVIMAEGGCVCWGEAGISASGIQTATYAASGGAVTGGAAVDICAVSFVSGHGADAGGQAAVQCGPVAYAVGGAIVGGSAECFCGVSGQTYGGCVCGGDASVEATGPQSVVFAASGGSFCGGGALFACGAALPMRGGCVCGGSAVAVAHGETNRVPKLTVTAEMKTPMAVASLRTPMAVVEFTV